MHRVAQQHFQPWNHSYLLVGAGRRGGPVFGRRTARAACKHRGSSRDHAHTRKNLASSHIVSIIAAMQYRFAQSDEIPAIARLVAHSFPRRGPEWWTEQLRDPLFGGGPETLLVGQESGRFVAACQLHPLRQWVGGAALQVSGIATVTVAPTHRKRRLGAELVTAALRASRERGDVASALYPFRISFYRRLGYGNAGQTVQFLVPAESLTAGDGLAHVDALENDAQRAQALELYNHWAQTQTGQLERSERIWNALTSAPGRALLGFRNPSGELEGYALVIYRADLDRPARFLEVEELVWLTPEIRRSIYGWLGSLGDQWERLLLRALPSHRLEEWLDEPRLPFGSAPPWGQWAPSAILLTGPMFRLLDLSAAWAERRIATGLAQIVNLDVADAQIPENAGSWRLSLEGGRAHIARGGGSGGLRLGLDISCLSRLFIGSLAPSTAHEAGLLECDRPELLPGFDVALALPQPWMFDRF